MISAGIVLSVILVVVLIKRNSFKGRLIRIALEEFSKWNLLSELSPKVSEHLVRYWQSVGLHFSPVDMQNPSMQDRYPWSSAFISYLFFKAGAGNRFPYGAAHNDYYEVARNNRDNPNAPLRGLRIDEYAPKKGDLVVFSREAGKGYDTRGFFKSHGELVLGAYNGYIITIGGNVSNGVKISRFSTDHRGFLTKKERDFFMVIQNNIR